LLILLDESFDVMNMHEAELAVVEEVIDAPGSRARSERRALAISQITAISLRVWPS